MSEYVSARERLIEHLASGHGWDGSAGPMFVREASDLIDAFETAIRADCRDALVDARRLAFPFSLSPVQRERIVRRLDAQLIPEDRP